MNQRVDYIQDESENHRAAKAFIRALLAELNNALTEKRISKAKRRDICESFAYSLCTTLDQCWVRADGHSYFPLVAFTKQFLDIGDSLDDVSPIQMPDRSVAFYEMFGDEADWLFDECGGTSPPDVVGNLLEVLPDEDLPTEPDTEMIRLPCSVCQGMGKCFCLRKGTGDATGCPRCSGTGECRHCNGTGTPKWG